MAPLTFHCVPAFKMLMIAGVPLARSIFAWFLFVLINVSARAGDETRIVVVYNANDPDAQKLAFFYASKRNIAKERVLAVQCATDEEISREEYVKNIERPIRDAFDRNRWWQTLPDFQAVHPMVLKTDIRFIALIRGIPLKIAESKEMPRTNASLGPAPTVNTNAACVDSELAALGIAAYTEWSLIPNPYYRSYLPIEDSPFNDLLLVSRLDGPTPGDVQAMIEKSIEAEKNGLVGRAYVDLVEPGVNIAAETAAVGNAWMLGAAEQCRQVGIPVIVERTKTMLGRGFPMRDAILYYGWYQEHATGPFSDPNFRFTPGAVAIHLHSFSGQSIRDPSRGWVGPLVARGVAATIGNVYEPYLAFTPQIDIFNERLLAGFTFAESAYMSLRAVSWMTCVIGDPLYRPFDRWHEISKVADAKSLTNPWIRFRQAAIDCKISESPRPMDRLQKIAEQTKDPILLEGIALWKQPPAKLQDRLALLELAEAGSKGTDNAALAIDRIFLLRDAGQKAAALEIARDQIPLYEGDLKAIFEDLAFEIGTH